MATEIITYEGAGNIRFGMARDDVRRLFREAAQPFRRGGIVETDHFRISGILVEYDEGICNAVELLAKAGPHFRDKPIVGVPYCEIAAWFREIDPDIEEDGAGLISKLHGVALYAPSAKKDPGAPVESAAAFARGYYDHPHPVIPLPGKRDTFGA